MPKELVERVGAWAEVFLKRMPGYTAVETREETRPGKKSSTGKRVTVAEYSARPEGDGQVVETRKPISSDGRAAEKGKPSEDSSWPTDRLYSPFALVARLAERNQYKMKFFFPQDTSEVASEYVLIGYRQTEGEGLAEVEGKAVYPRGQAWVNPDDGRIFRIEDEVLFKNTRYTTGIEFGRDNELKTWLPRQITARVFEKGRMEQQVVITYNGFNSVAADRAGAAAPSSKP